MTTTSPAGLHAEDLYRLPTNLKPIHYDLVFQTDLDELTFQGVVSISLNVEIATSRIVLNASDLKLEKASVRMLEPFQKSLPIASSSYDGAYQRATYILNDPIPSQANIVLSIRYSGKLSESRRGYFKSSWMKEGKIKYYALTQFEAIAARNAFPCWDEPLFKATFSITMISAGDTVSLSNMPVASEVVVGSGASLSPDIAGILAAGQAGRWKITTFHKTPPMSSYIVAYANGHFEHSESSVVMPLSGKTIPLRIYAPPDLIHQTQFALDVTKAVLPLYEKTFGVEYPLPKLDTLVAHDFEGAMENWGLIIGTKQGYLLDPAGHTQEDKMTAFTYQCHEVAHQWFGNITTMKWWDNLYLNEGFATLMGELLIADKVYPEWRMGSEFVAGHLGHAMSLDAKRSSHPIEVECPDANRINEIFDALSYSKAGSVLRMLSHYVGEDKFLRGVSIYLKAHLFSNTVTQDLWKGISVATGIDVANFMDNWVSKIGYPVLTVTEDSEGIHVRQDRFLETGPADAKDNETIWNIPLSFLSYKDGNTSVDRSIVLREREMSIACDTTKLYKLNAGTSGVYRVIYTPEHLARIAREAAKDQSIFSLDDRIGLVHDAFALTKAGYAKISATLTIVNQWKAEKEYLVWSVVATSIGELVSIWWENTEVVDKLKAFQQSLFVPLVKKLGYEYDQTESKDITLLRTLAITEAANAGDVGVVKELQERFKYYLDTGDNSKVLPELQQIIYITAVKHGSRPEYDGIVKISQNSRNPAEEKAAIIAMCAAQQLELIHETTTFFTNKARDHDLVTIFKALAENFAARRLATQFLMQNYDKIYERMKDQFTLGPLVSASTACYSSDDDYASIEAFFKGKDTSKYSQALAQILDSIKARSAYVQRSTTDLTTWLNKNQVD